MSKLFTIFYYTLALGALGLGTILVLMQTDVIPGYDVRIVQSGSMEPAITTGSVVIIQDRERYEVGDIITFGGDQSPDGLPTTHRIIEDRLQDGELVFITQGDANDSPDVEPIRPEGIRGTVIFDIPILGFILDFARQPLGFALLIGIPAAFIVFEESSNIYHMLRSKREEDADEEPEGTDDGDATPTDPDDDSGSDTEREGDTPDPRHIASADTSNSTPDIRWESDTTDSKDTEKK